MMVLEIIKTILWSKVDHYTMGLYCMKQNMKHEDAKNGERWRMKILKVKNERN